MKRIFCFLFALFILSTTTMLAEEFPDGGITIKEMAGILSEKGYRAEIHYPEKDDTETYITSSTQGKIFCIYFYDIAKDERAGSVQYCISFKPSEKIDSSAVLEWNAHYRYARMYLSKSNTSYFEMDRDIAHGLTRAAIDNDFERWESLINSIVEFVDQRTASKEDQS